MVATLSDVIVFEVSDPCENVIYTAQISPELSVNQIGTFETFNVTFEDNVSVFFESTELCGPLRF